MRCVIAVLVVSCWSAVLGAQEAVATAGVNVRSGQSKSSSILGHLNAGDTVTLLSPTTRRSYYHVEESDGTKGWVYARYLVLVDDSTSGHVGATPPPVSPPVSPPTTGGAVSAVDANWAKATPQVAVFHRSGFPDCAAAGGTGDTLTDRLKNRIDEPRAYHPVTFDAVLALPYPKNHKPHRTDWPQSDLDVIAPYEGIPVTVTGFIATQNGIIVQNAQHSRNGEATNCHATDDAGVDWHVTLVTHPNDPKSAGIVVETTPRVRANGHPWTADMLTPHVAAGDSVRFSGWLMYDPEHFAQTTNYDPARPSTGRTVRATLWEVHPVTRIEVFDGQARQWRTLP
jgi:uncharacterized protein YraI